MNGRRPAIPNRALTTILQPHYWLFGDLEFAGKLGKKDVAIDVNSWKW